jgi:hypothetical protein
MPLLKMINSTLVIIQPDHLPFSPAGRAKEVLGGVVTGPGREEVCFDVAFFGRVGA